MMDSHVNLAARRLGAGVIAASDEFFGEKENLLRPEPPAFRPRTFGHKGQVVDGWESRRRREPGHDWALIRLGAPGVIHGVVVDTAHFTGNFPAECSVEACAAEGYPSAAQLQDPGPPWVPIVPRSPLAGDSENRFVVADARRFTHLRPGGPGHLVFPRQRTRRGGAARLRRHGSRRGHGGMVRPAAADAAAARHPASVPPLPIAAGYPCTAGDPSGRRDGPAAPVR